MQGWFLALLVLMLIIRRVAVAPRFTLKPDLLFVCTDRGHRSKPADAAATGRKRGIQEFSEKLRHRVSHHVRCVLAGVFCHVHVGGCAGADWLQGPYVYALYQHYGFSIGKTLTHTHARAHTHSTQARSACCSSSASAAVWFSALWPAQWQINSETHTF